MPIKTAPKDGSHLLLFRPEIQFTGYWGGSNSGWRINAPGLPAMWPLPTHWMSLPASPPNKPLHSDKDEDEIYCSKCSRAIDANAYHKPPACR